jgi:hypothetical protein
LQLKYHSHVTEERLAAWEQEAEAAISEFERDLEERRSELLRDREMSGELHSVAETYDETVLSNLDASR